MTPAELSLMAEVYAETERTRERMEWERLSWLAAQLINISGKSVRRLIKPKDLISFPADVGATPQIDMEERKRQAIETLKLHKAKCWTRIKDKSVQEIAGDK